MILYFERHFSAYTGANNVKPYNVIKYIKVVKEHGGWTDLDAFKVRAVRADYTEDSKGVNINEVWVDLDKYILRGINIPMISEVVIPYVRMLKLNKIKKKINVKMGNKY